MSATRQDAREVAQRLVDAYNRKDGEAHAGAFAEDARYWSALGGWREGRDAIAAHMRELFAAMPDERMRVVRQATDGETLVMEVVSTGVDGEGRSYGVSFTEVLEIRDGAVVEARVYLDPDDVDALVPHA